MHENLGAQILLGVQTFTGEKQKARALLKMCVSFLSTSIKVLEGVNSES